MASGSSDPKNNRREPNTNNNPKQICSKCTANAAITVCSGCKQLFCFKHVDKHREELSKQMENVGQEYDALKQKFDQQKTKHPLFDEIDQWEKESIEKIRRTSDTARGNLKQLTEQSKNRLSELTKQLSSGSNIRRPAGNVSENELNLLKQYYEDFRKEIDKLSQIQLFKDDVASLQLIKIIPSDKKREGSSNSSTQNNGSTEEKQSSAVTSNKPPQDGNTAAEKSGLLSKISPTAKPQSSAYPSITFGLSDSTRKNVQRLFKNLMLLSPMDINGPMSGKCSRETEQMEQFLIQAFGFRNIPGKNIVQGVRSFKLDKPPHSMSLDTKIHFPVKSETSFVMTVKEILDWQSSYRVYASKEMKGMTKDFLRFALQGQSRDGEEAFRMKFVVRISTCPILMEFDAKIISRKSDEDWPNRIKLVSVTGIDFAGRKHDLWDIVYYVSNWKEVFELDQTREAPALLNERDFAWRKGGPPGELHQSALLGDLTLMARLRLRACDVEGVQVVVETGIGLGVFSGKHIRVDDTVRITSAIAIRTVLEQDGPSYKNIRAIIFALPIFDKTRSDHRIYDTFDNFAEQFQEPQYRGCIPVLIADQDMHRLTVAIAREGFIVSELNPADSHGVFGEYWQNRGPAVEEKLALTTVGLLVQHHLINPQVLEPNNYYLV